jgi:hypothetical protein
MLSYILTIIILRISNVVYAQLDVFILLKVLFINLTDI